MQQDQLFFETVKVDRHWYFVEYGPPVAASPFATLQLVFPEADNADVGRVASAMEEELCSWLERYPVPVMVSSFDETDSLIALGAVRACDHLTGWRDPASGVLVTHWRLIGNAEFPRASWDPASLRLVYRDIPFRTTTELGESFRKRQRRVKFGWWLIFIWAVAVPAGIAVVEFNAPQWLAFLVLGYSLLRAYIQAFKLMGRWPKTEAELVTEAENREMEHHHYHCERNPEGFRRLKRENFEREAREQIQREAAVVRRSGGARGSSGDVDPQASGRG